MTPTAVLSRRARAMETSSTSMKPGRLVRPVSSSWKARYASFCSASFRSVMFSIIVTANSGLPSSSR